jgi:hypothetical protein
LTFGRGKYSRRAVADVRGSIGLGSGPGLEIRNGWFTSNKTDRFPTHILGQFRPGVLAARPGLFIPTNKKFFGNRLGLGLWITIHDVRIQ